jgi:hypothetical protein
VRGHESDHRSAKATHRRSFRVQITEHNVRPIWCTIENWYGVLVIDESTATDWPILLSATVRSKIGYSAAAEEYTGDRYQISLHAPDYASRVNRVRELEAWQSIPQPTAWQRIGNQINAAFVFARADFVKLLNLAHFRRGIRFTITAAAAAAKIVCKTNLSQIMFSLV